LNGIAVRKQLSCLALSLAASTGVHADNLELPKTPEGYYALGEQFGQCAAFITFLGRLMVTAGKTEAGRNYAYQRESWRRASVISLGLGRAADAMEAAQAIEGAEINKVQARFDAGPPTAINDMYDDYRRRCDPIEPLKESATKVQESTIKAAH
jgi:hypothetical protein